MSTAMMIQRSLSSQTQAEKQAEQKGIIQTASRVASHFYDSKYHHSINFFDGSGEVMYSTLPTNQWPYAKVFGIDTPVARRMITNFEMADPADGERVVVYRFNWFLNGIPVGYVQFVIPLIPKQQQFLFSGRLIAIFAATYAMLIILFGILILKQMVISPVQKLNMAVSQLTAGNRDFKLPIDEKNEFGQLANNFHNMAYQLYENELRQSEQIEELLLVNEELDLTRRGLIRSEKLASIGKLAAGVAHEVGNPMSAILGYVALLRDGGLDEETQNDFLSRIEKDITRINIIIRGLLDYSRPQKERIERLNINEVIEESIDLIHPQKQLKKITFDFTSHYKPAYVNIDRYQVQQVLVNLFLNASQAMNEEGPITIFLENVEFDPSLTFRDTASKFKSGQRLISVAVIDQGVGISEDMQAKIFDPFFTTKEPGQGTGLGLSVSDKIIDTFGGTLQVTSQPNEGATFMILLPEAEELQDDENSSENGEITDQQNEDDKIEWIG